MIVTDRKYSLEPALIEKLNLLCGRCSGNYNHQNVIICDGTEGYGKSTLTACCAYYMAWKLRRPLKLFFDLEEMMKYAIEHEDEILIWDDAAFAALSIEAYNKAIIKFIKPEAVISFEIGALYPKDFKTATPVIFCELIVTRKSGNPTLKSNRGLSEGV